MSRIAALGSVRREVPTTLAGTAPGRRAPRRPRSRPSRRSRTRSSRSKRRSSEVATVASGSARSPGQAAKAEADAYGDPYSSGGLSGRTCQNRAPAAASQSTNAYASEPSRPPGSEVGWRLTPRERVSHIARLFTLSGMASPRIQIQDVQPQVDGGRFPAKACLGDAVPVSATIFRDGHARICGVVRFRPAGTRRWRETHTRGERQRSLRGDHRPRRARALGAPDPGLGRPVRELARRVRSQGRSRPGRSRRRAVGRASSSSARVRSTTGGPLPSGLSDRERHGTAKSAGLPARRRSRAGTVRRLVRAVPALVGRIPRRRRRVAGHRGSRLRHRLPATRAPDRRDPPQGPQQRRASTEGRRR